MYHLRRLIRDREIGVVDKGLRFGKNALGGDMESLMDEALQSKCPEDGQNLLMYAAAQGNEAWFIHLAGDIRSRVSMGRHQNMGALLRSTFEFTIYDCLFRVSTILPWLVLDFLGSQARFLRTWT